MSRDRESSPPDQSPRKPELQTGMQRTRADIDGRAQLDVCFRDLRGSRGFGRATAVGVMLLGLGLLAAACGNGPAQPGVASLGSTTTTAPAAPGSSSLLPSRQQVYQ